MSEVLVVTGLSWLSNPCSWFITYGLGSSTWLGTNRSWRFIYNFVSSRALEVIILTFVFRHGIDHLTRGYLSTVISLLRVRARCRWDRLVAAVGSLYDTRLTLDLA
jgi:hypothetical protein